MMHVTNLACGIDDVTIIFGILKLDRLRKCIFDRWIIRLHKVALDKLND